MTILCNIKNDKSFKSSKPLLLPCKGLPYFSTDVKKRGSGWIKKTRDKDRDSWIYEVKEGFKKGESSSESFTRSGTQYYRAWTEFLTLTVGKEKQNKHNNKRTNQYFLNRFKWMVCWYRDKENTRRSQRDWHMDPWIAGEQLD